ncbi:MAG: glutamine--fructose-6-phosphate transaminase (isomerizing) [Cytophagia bacterium]|nr:glutamine--fructose-6-phosphate transaminase (isomerizing) [Cytophagia bacterium]
MCGIIGYVGPQNAKDIIIKGLKRLEYRGYDSVGLATFEKNKINSIKCAGKVHDLEQKIDTSKFIGTSGIGHTRWATHGEPNSINAHPHVSNDGKIHLIHNGVIENYKSLKEFLIGENVKFTSDTDTEVLVQLISYIYNNEDVSFEEAVKLSLSKAVGAYGIIVMNSENKNELIAARKGSPVVIGINDKEYFISSDTSSIIEHTKNILYLDENEIISIKGDNYKVTNIDNNLIVDKKIEYLDINIEQIEKGNFEHFMLKEIFEQPAAILNAMRGRIDYSNNTIKLGGINDYALNILNSDMIYITACGTSWHAALLGSYMLENLIDIPVKVEYASEFRYRKTTVTPNSTVIAISQSGETADTLAAIAKAKYIGARTLGVVNVVGSSIAREADCGVYIHAGPEIGVASTKAFTSQVVTLNLISLFLSQTKGVNQLKINKLISEMSSIPDKIEAILSFSDEIKEIAKYYKDANNFLYLGRGFQFPVALEGALKLKEISYIHAEGYPAAEMKHGPIALIDNKMPVVFIVSKKGYSKILSNIEEVKARGGKIIIVTSVDDDELNDYSDHIIKVPHTHKFLSPILKTIPLQLLSYHIAVLKDCNVDQPRNLAKSVTVE